MKQAMAGSFESCDCLIMVKEHDSLLIEIESIVFEQFGDEIHCTIIDTLNDLGITNIYLKCLDKGAYDYTIRARIKTAIKRLNELS